MRRQGVCIVLAAEDDDALRAKDLQLTTEHVLSALGPHRRVWVAALSERRALHMLNHRDEVQGLGERRAGHAYARPGRRQDP
jgi:hypothetical protein